MVSITREDGDVSNELLSGITDNLKFFIENITCVRETFGFSQTTLSTQLNKTRKEFINFTQSLWINEITADDTGSMFYQYLKDVLEIDQLYDDTKNKYDILYKEMNIEKTAKNNVIITLILVITLIINAINIIFLAR